MKRIKTKFLLLFYIIISITSTSALATSDSDALYFYLVRHGQTYSNIKEMTIGGGGNAQLTTKGRYDARSLGLGLEDVDFIAGYSSTLGRAHETASNILTGRNMDIIEIENLKDISWGNAEGGRIDDLTSQYGHSGNEFEYYFGNYKDKNFKSVVNTESMYDFSQRFESALLDIANRHKNETGNILAVGHSSMAFYLQKYRQDKPLSGLSNTAVSVLKYKDGQFTLIDFNNTDYLKSGYAKQEKLPPLEISIVINPMTILNDANVMEGTSDSDLSKSGVAAVNQLKQHINPTDYLAVYSSTLNRAKYTANHLFENSTLPIQINRNLDEIFLGLWEAEKISTLEKDPKGQFTKLHSGKNVLSFESPVDGETGAIAAYRLESLLRDIGIKNEFHTGKIMVVTHPIIFSAFLNKVQPEHQFIPKKDLQLITLQYKNEKFSVKNIQSFNGK